MLPSDLRLWLGLRCWPLTYRMCWAVMLNFNCDDFLEPPVLFPTCWSAEPLCKKCLVCKASNDTIFLDQFFTTASRVLLGTPIFSVEEAWWTDHSLLPTISVKHPNCFFTFLLTTPSLASCPSTRSGIQNLPSPQVCSNYSVGGRLVIYILMLVFCRWSPMATNCVFTVPLPQFLTCNFPVSPYKLTNLCQALSFLLIQGVTAPVFVAEPL